MIANDSAVDTAKTTKGDRCLHDINARPQRLHTWLNLIPVAEFESKRPERIAFLDTFVTVSHNRSESDKPYEVLFEDRLPMTYVIHLGIIFVWYGDDLSKPDRPFPKLYQKLYDSKYVSSKPVVFENTHVMDFVENGSDNLHFRHVHLWEYSKIYNHQVTADTITLEQDTRIHYGRSSFSPFIRAMSYILPELELHHDYVYHGPGISVVGYEGKGAPEAHSIVTLTPEGHNRTRVYVTMALPETTFPRFLEKTFQAVSGGRRLCDQLAGVIANYIQNEFDVDAVIWNSRNVVSGYNLLPTEKHLQNVIDWGKTFYPKDFVEPKPPAVKPDGEKQWVYLADDSNIKQEEVISFTVNGESLIAFKDSQGNIQVRDAYCPHQGAHLGVQSKIENDCVRCPFHGFYYDLEGKCRGQNINNTSRALPGLQLKIIKHRQENGRVEVYL